MPCSIAWSHIKTILVKEIWQLFTNHNISLSTMNRFFKNFWVGAFASILLACAEDPATQADPCQSPPVITDVKITPSSCASPIGGVLAKAGGGNGMLLFSLNGKDFQESGQFTNLSEGTYTLLVKDEKNCQLSQEIVVGISNDMTLSIASVARSGCGTAEGSVHLQASGGEEEYTYSLDGSTFQEEAVFNNLPAGEFKAFVKDAAACISGTDFSIQSGISYSSSVKTIIETNCAVRGCHVSGTGRADFELFSQVQKNASKILSYTKSGAMPPKSSGKSLSAKEVEAIGCWVNDGALQN